MKYLCLVYLDEQRLDELPDEDCVAYDTAIRSSGHCLASEALQSVHTATTVRVRGGKVSVTDGPFAETKEQLADSRRESRQRVSAASKYGRSGRSAKPSPELTCCGTRTLKTAERRRGRIWFPSTIHQENEP